MVSALNLYESETADFVVIYHKHTEDGEIESVAFDGLRELYREFKNEVRDYGEPWD